MSKPIGVGVVGLGFMGATHGAAYRRADAQGFANRLVAVSDRNPERRTKGSDAAGSIASGADGKVAELWQSAHWYATPEELFADPEVQLVSLCTPTDSHIELAQAALRQGKHVLLEKPVALASQEIHALARIATQHDRICMPAMCMRYWPGWSELLQAAASGRYGKVLRADFARLSRRPSWGQGFYADPRRCGGALFDLHIHDADFVRCLLGEPRSVHTAGSLDHPVVRYRFEGATARAEGSWEVPDAEPFQMRYEVEFESAEWSFDLRREAVCQVRSGDRVESIPIASETGYDGEIQHILACLREGRVPSCNLEDAARTVALLERERESLQSGTWVTC